MTTTITATYTEGSETTTRTLATDLDLTDRLADLIGLGLMLEVDGSFDFNDVKVSVHRDCADVSPHADEPNTATISVGDTVEVIKRDFTNDPPIGYRAKVARTWTNECGCYVYIPWDGKPDHEMRACEVKIVDEHDRPSLPSDDGRSRLAHDLRATLRSATRDDGAFIEYSQGEPGEGWAVERWDRWAMDVLELAGSIEQHGRENLRKQITERLNTAASALLTSDLADLADTLDRHANSCRALRFRCDCSIKDCARIGGKERGYAHSAELVRACIAGASEQEQAVPEHNVETLTQLAIEREDLPRPRPSNELLTRAAICVRWIVRHFNARHLDPQALTTFIANTFCPEHDNWSLTDESRKLIKAARHQDAIHHISVGDAIRIESSEAPAVFPVGSLHKVGTPEVQPDGTKIYSTPGLTVLEHPAAYAGDFPSWTCTTAELKRHRIEFMCAPQDYDIELSVNGRRIEPFGIATPAPTLTQLRDAAAQNIEARGIPVRVIDYQTIEVEAYLVVDESGDADGDEPQCVRIYAAPDTAEDCEPNEVDRLAVPCKNVDRRPKLWHKDRLIANVAKRKPSARWDWHD